MKTIFNKADRTDLVSRIASINENCEGQWGKMNLYQMLNHCIIWDKWILGKDQSTYKKQTFMGVFFGRMALKSMIKNEAPFSRNIPTGKDFIVKEKDGDIELLKQQWISLVEDYGHYSNPDFIHDFFGRMSKEQIGILAYKHTDHHLRQFNC